MMEEYLKPTYFVDFDSPIVMTVARDLTRGISDSIERAKIIFTWTRDEIRYDPYNSLFIGRSKYKASSRIKAGFGWCVQKACVLIALARAVGIPARFHFADIINYQVTEKLLKAMGTNLFVYHGYADLYLNDKWVKATPAFGRTLCNKFGLRLVEFDGIHDAILPETTLNGEKHVEYVKDRGTAAEFPFEEIFREFQKVYPFAGAPQSSNK
ncbi:MAG: transglutaminase-like domain-containing protein [Candidatus Helarchaeales archaeon]